MSITAKGETMKGLEAFFESLADAASSGNPSAYVAHYLDDSTLLLPRRAPIVGHPAIGAFFEKFQRKLVLVLDQYEQMKTEVLGNVALVHSQGSGHYLVKSTGERVPFVQNYLDVLKQVGGRWLLAYHAASSANVAPGIWDRAWESDVAKL